MTVGMPPRRFLAAAALVVLLAVAAYGGLGANDFVTLDDGDYITLNHQVRQGWTLPGAAWAFTTTHAGNWHPLTWLSHMLDVEMFGMDAGRHHLVSLALHAANALVLLGLLNALTGALWPSALAAAILAVHPQHVESVAWASERKDVLALFFSLAAALAYVRAARRNAVLRSWSVPLLYAMALLSKPMPVTLPFVFLLLDGWPLGRWAIPGAAAQPGRWFPPASLWGEKALLFLFAAASSAMTMRAQSHVILGNLPLSDRLGTALLAVTHYLEKIVWPATLSAFYPFAPPLPLPVAGAGVLIAALTAVCLLGLRRRPYLALGWFWFIGALVPVIGLVKVGSQSWADRYAYLPAIGIYVAGVWLATAALARRPRRATAAAGAAVAVLLLLTARTRAQVALWENDLTLFTHTLRVDPRNWVAHNSIGLLLQGAGRRDEARTHFEKALAALPRYHDAHVNLAMVLAAEGRLPEAEEHLLAAIEVYPASPIAQSCLGNLLFSTGRAAAGMRHLTEAVKLDPTLELPRVNLANALILDNRPEEALPQFEAAVRINPGNAGSHDKLGYALHILGRDALAVPEFETAVRLAPGSVDSHNNLGYVLHLLGRDADAVLRYRTALKINPSSAPTWNNLGLALAGLERHEEALAAYRSSIAVQPGQSGPHLNLAVSLTALGDVTGAAREYQEALRIDPRSVDARRSPSERAVPPGPLPPAAPGR